MSELVVSSYVYSRFKAAAKNGSKIAQAVCHQLLLAWLNGAESVFRGHVNYIFGKIIVSEDRSDAFYGCKKRCSDYHITYCGKDLANPAFPDHDNPRAMYEKKNRTICDLSTFVSKFKNIDTSAFSESDYRYLISCMLLGKQVYIDVCTQVDEIDYAYSGLNYFLRYQVNNLSLFHSCMRSYKNLCGSFYANFAGAKLLMVYVKERGKNRVVGRALYWEDVTATKCAGAIRWSGVKYLDRRYFSFEFIDKLLIDYAKNDGAEFVRVCNGIDPGHLVKALTSDILCVIGGASFYIYVYKTARSMDSSSSFNGFPYVDTFSYIIPEGSELQLSSSGSAAYIQCKRTDAMADLCSGIAFEDLETSDASVAFDMLEYDENCVEPDDVYDEDNDWEDDDDDDDDEVDEDTDEAYSDALGDESDLSLHV